MQLIVAGQPMLILGGEVHNSSSSSAAYMRGVWPTLAAMHLNSVLTPVAWETIEPKEGQFDFTCVDGLLEGARANHLHLVLLWFGSWKNTFSTYVPAWVKENQERFPRVQLSDGHNTERLSPFSRNVRSADARAFAALLRHLRDVDGEQHTVLMVQVENEVGVIPESRDHSSMAEETFRSSVPRALTQYLVDHRSTLEPELRSAWEAAGARTDGTWQQVFGGSALTDDVFMAWHFASVVQEVAAAGKAIYPLPMYANAALSRPNYEPGQYNSGGPLPHSIDIWRAAAPALDMVSPDIYFENFARWAEAYARPGNPLFVPESQGGATGAANALFAFGRLNAIGFSPFGIDDLGNAPLDLVGITNPAEKPDPGAVPALYAILEQLSPRLLSAQQQGDVTAVLLESAAQRSARARLGEYTATVSPPFSASNPSARIGAMFLHAGPNEYWVVGSGDAQVTFSTDQPGPPRVGIESIDEMYCENGVWTPRRRLNGDETSQGQSLRLNASDAARGRIYRVRLYREP